MNSQSTPVLTTQEQNSEIDSTLILNGKKINLRKTHPNLYLLVMLLAVSSLALGANFLIFTPTFRIYDLPNLLWGLIFLTLGLAEIFFLSVFRNLVMARLVMAFSVVYFSLLTLGTMQPALEGKGSLQLPILYGTLVTIKLATLLEPFINPWTAKRDV